MTASIEKRIASLEAARVPEKRTIRTLLDLIVLASDREEGHDPPVVFDPVFKAQMDAVLEVAGDDRKH